MLGILEGETKLNRRNEQGEVGRSRFDMPSGYGRAMKDDRQAARRSIFVMAQAMIDRDREREFERSLTIAN